MIETNDRTNKYIGLPAECLEDAGFQYTGNFSGLKHYRRRYEDTYDIVFTETENDNEKIYRMFLDCKGLNR